MAKSNPKKTVAEQRAIQAQVAKADKKPKKKSGAMQAGARKYPEPPLPQQHQLKPGKEAALDPAPMYDAPFYKGSGKLEGMAAIITGGDSGIGRSVAILFAREGADVAILHLDEDEDAKVTKKAVEKEGRRAIIIAGDVRDQAFCKAAVEEAFKAFGRLDILVNNSGVYAFSAIEEVTESEYRRQFDVNVLGVLLTTKAAIPHLGEGSSVINISSNITSVLVPQSAIYAGTKGAVDAITGVLAKELGPRGIRVNAILPGMTETEGTATAGFDGSDLATQIVAQTPLGRTGRPDDIAGLAVFLASDDAGWLTGEKINASGGLR